MVKPLCLGCMDRHPPLTGCRIPAAPHYVTWHVDEGHVCVIPAPDAEEAEAIAEAVRGAWGHCIPKGRSRGGVNRRAGVAVVKRKPWPIDGHGMWRLLTMARDPRDPPVYGSDEAWVIAPDPPAKAP